MHDTLITQQQTIKSRIFPSTTGEMKPKEEKKEVFRSLMSFSVVMEQRSVRRPTHRRNYHPSYKNESQEVFHDTVR